jgi:hypothetical protein
VTPFRSVHGAARPSAASPEWIWLFHLLIVELPTSGCDALSSYEVPSPSVGSGPPSSFFFSWLRFHGRNRWMSEGTLPPAAAQHSKYHVSHFRGLSSHTANVPKIKNAAAAVTRRVRGKTLGDLIFTSERGAPWSKGLIAKAVRGTRVRAGLGEHVTAYSIRHWWCTEKLRARVPITHVVELMGHASTAMISRVYGHRGDHADDLRAAVEQRVEPSTSRPAPRLNHRSRFTRSQPSRLRRPPSAAEGCSLSLCQRSLNAASVFPAPRHWP